MLVCCWLPPVLVIASTFNLYQSGAPDLPSALNAQAITDVGGDGSHTNLQPFLCINCIVALFGIFPARN